MPVASDSVFVASLAAASEPSDHVLTLLQMQRDLLREAAAGADAKAVLALLVELIESQAPGAIASVLLVDREAGALRTLVAPRLPEAYSAAVDGIVIAPIAGSCGSAAALKRTVVVEDIRTDPLWADYRELAAEYGLRACWSTPVLDADHEVLGTFALYYRVPRRPSPRELELVEMAAGLASIVLERELAVEQAAVDAAERREVERRYRTLIEQLPLVIYVDALDASSSNIFTSKQIEWLLGYSVEEWKEDGDLFVKLLHPEDRERVLAAHERTHTTHEPLSLEYRLRSREGEYVFVRDEGVVVVDDDGTPLYLQGYLLDITPERAAEEQLRRQALYDPLTGLANRAFFNERLERAVTTRKGQGERTALLFVDLNGFKSINDRFGHHVGDGVLRALAERMHGVVRAGDTAARLGGDEFAVILERVVEAADVSAVAQRLHSILAEPLEVEDRRLVVEASIGIALGDDPLEMLKQADAAMYRAKASPGVGFAFFDAGLDKAALIRFRRTGELAEALDRGELQVHYQPIVELATGAVGGYEALLRWEHPLHGMLPPAEFIPLAEGSGSIVPIGAFVLREACLHAARLGAESGRALEMAVNVSARQLQHPDFVQHVEEALALSGLPPERLVLEITESVVLDTGDVEQRLPLLREKGIQIALDDFGTGYGSLAYLQRLPIDIVKIDRSFTATVDSDDNGRALLRAIVGFGNALGTRLVAEGIERQGQDDVVQELGCQRGQGWHYGRPAPADA
jgi:diguanylate cyclase (GGDEF)-like protein/PAS domain S-box-containing protein